MCRIVRVPDNLYILVLIDDCHITFTYDQLCEAVNCLNCHEDVAVRIMQISRNPKALLHRPLVPYFDIWQYGLGGRTDSATLLSNGGAQDVIAVAVIHPSEIIPAYIIEKLAHHPQQFGYYSLSALYENSDLYASSGACDIFEHRLECQDRLVSTGYH